MSQNKNVKGIFRCSSLHCLRAFRESVCFSLRSWEIGSLDFHGARRENVLSGAGYAWTPDLWSFLKLQEVEFSPYLSFIHILRVFRCFGWFEAVRGRLIGPKTWDRIVGIFLRISLVAVSVQSHVGSVWVDLCINLCFGMYRGENGHEIRVH